MASETNARALPGPPTVTRDWTTVGGFVALAALMAALFAWMRSDIGSEIDSTNARIDDLRLHFDGRLDDLRALVETRFEQVEARFERLEATVDRLDMRIAEVEHRMGGLEQRMARQEGLISGIVSVADIPRPPVDPDTETAAAE